MTEKRKVIKIGRYSQRNLLRPNWNVIHKEGKKHVYDVIVDEILEAYKTRGVEYVTNEKIDSIIMEKYGKTIKESTAETYRHMYKKYIKNFCGINLDKELRDKIRDRIINIIIAEYSKENDVSNKKMQQIILEEYKGKLNPKTAKTYIRKYKKRIKEIHGVDLYRK